MKSPTLQNFKVSKLTNSRQLWHWNGILTSGAKKRRFWDFLSNRLVHPEVNTDVKVSMPGTDYFGETALKQDIIYLSTPCGNRNHAITHFRCTGSGLHSNLNRQQNHTFSRTDKQQDFAWNWFLHVSIKDVVTWHFSLMSLCISRNIRREFDLSWLIILIQFSPRTEVALHKAYRSSK